MIPPEFLDFYDLILLKAAFININKQNFKNAEVK